MGWLQSLEGNPGSGAATLRGVIQVYRALYPVDSAYLQVAQLKLAGALVALGSRDEARRLVHDARPVLLHELVPGSPVIGLLARLDAQLGTGREDR
jgi:hypothetical protein